MMYWYLGESDSPAIAYFSDVLTNFDALVQAREADQPLSPFISQMLVAPKVPTVVFDGLYSLLSCLFWKDDSVANPYLTKVFMPEGFTKDKLDYFGVYLVLNCLEAMNVVSISSEVSNIVRQHFIFYLLSRNQWKWACFVALQLPNVPSRDLLVKDIIGRFASKIGWESSQSSEHDEIISNFGIPKSWIHEATAYVAGYLHQAQNQVKYFKAAQMWKEAAVTLATKIVPASFEIDFAVQSFDELVFLNSQYSFSSHVHHRDVLLCDIVLKFLNLRNLLSSETLELQSLHLRSLTESILQSIAVITKEYPQLRDEVDGDCAMTSKLLGQIASGAYRTLHEIDILVLKEDASKSMLFREFILQNAHIRKDFVRDSLLSCIDSVMCNSAKSLKL
jgi:hypothetical protein